MRIFDTIRLSYIHINTFLCNPAIWLLNIKYLYLQVRRSILRIMNRQVAKVFFTWQSYTERCLSIKRMMKHALGQHMLHYYERWKSWSAAAMSRRMEVIAQVSMRKIRESYGCGCVVIYFDEYILSLMRIYTIYMSIVVITYIILTPL